MIQESLKVENTPHTIAECILFLEQPRPYFLPSSRPAATNLARKDTCHSVPETLCALWYIIKYREQIKSYYHIYLEEKKNKTVGLNPTFLAQEITWDK